MTSLSKPDQSHSPLETPGPHQAGRLHHWSRGQPLSLRGVGVSRRGDPILRDVNLTFEPGRRYVIIGPSGAGKSTLLRLLNRLDDPGQGEILLGDMPIRTLPIPEVRTNVGLVFQSPRALPGSVMDNLAYPYEVRGQKRPSAVAMAAALGELGLPETWLNRDATSLSGGERQRLAIAVTLNHNPEFLVMDEPTSALDPSSARRVMELLAQRTATTGLRTVIVTHHRGHAPELGDTAVRMENGRVVDVGPLNDILGQADGSIWDTGPPAKGSS